MSIHLRVRRWVAWWIGIGIACGAVAAVNLLGQNMTGVEDRTLIILGTAHWLLGGIVCWAFEGVKVETPAESRPPQIQEQTPTKPATQFYAASDLVLPGSKRHILHWRH